MRHTSTRRRRAQAPPREDPSSDWVRHEEYTANGRLLEYGTEFSVRGESGRFRFAYAIETPTGVVWVDGIGGRPKEPMWRSFPPDRIKTVHRITKTRASHEEEAA